MRSIVAATLVAAVPLASPAAPPPSGEAAEIALRLLNHRLIAAFSTSDVGFLDGLAGADFRMIGRSGVRLDRAGTLAAVARVSEAAGASYDDVRVRLFGPVALLHGVFESLDAVQREPLRVRYTDVFHWDGTAWRLVSAQTTPLRAGVGKAIARGSAPAVAAWTGADPGGDDLDVLRQLNERYVQAFRDADVAWYDAHLAGDYVVTNSDGSFADRAGALAAFARPTFATQLKTFPVDQVHIRRFGDVALIEAENAYETRDGRHGISRYTDVWHKAGDGRWRCISAHITVFKAP